MAKKENGYIAFRMGWRQPDRFALVLFFLLLLKPNFSLAEDLTTNEFHFVQAPSFVTPGRLNRIAEKIQKAMEWSIRRVTVRSYATPEEFLKMHSLGPLAVAVTFKQKNLILLGPKVTKDNFDTVFAHELVHVISFQKYKDAIPKWLEEGLANHLSKNSKVNFRELAKHPFPKDVRELVHPYRGDADEVKYHYQASQALVEMISAKCDFENLMRLSVGRKMEDYLSTYCGFKDITKSFVDWIQKKQKD